MFLAKTLLIFTKLVHVLSDVFDKINIFIDDVVIIGLYIDKVYNLSNTSLYSNWNWAVNQLETGHFQHNYWKSPKNSPLCDVAIMSLGI